LVTTLVAFPGLS